MSEHRTGNGSRFTKLWPDAHAALSGIARDGMQLAIGGFGLCGIPEALVLALRNTGVRNLTIASNNAGVDDWGIGLLLRARQVKKMSQATWVRTTSLSGSISPGELED